MRVEFMNLQQDVHEKAYIYEIRMLREYIEQDLTKNKVFEDLTKIVELKATIIDLEMN